MVSPRHESHKRIYLPEEVVEITVIAELRRKGKHLLHAGRIRNVADDALIRTGADLFLDLHADGLEVEPHFLEDIHGHALAEFD